MSSGAAFRLFGFPVHVRAGFLLLLGLVVFINGADFGLWLAGFLALFTLLHELGHAFAARATGARAEIALDFLYGYASFVPTRELRRWERAGISFAGPAVQIAVSVAALAALGVNPLDLDSVADASSAAQALWWAGPVIGAFNLIPVLPFDGGNIALVGIESVVGRAARDVMLVISLVLTAAAGVWILADPGRRPWLLLVVFPLIAQAQMWTQRADARRGGEPLAAAEYRAWHSGDLSGFRRGMPPSPWLEAAVLLRHDRRQQARQRLLDAFADPAPARWAPPLAAPLTTMEQLIGLLGDPLPRGNLRCELELAGALVALGEYPRAAAYSADSYHRAPTAASALLVARSAAALADRPTAVGWLRAARTRGDLPPNWFRLPEFAAYRDDPEFGQLAST